jgi:hypothetical protein
MGFFYFQIYWSGLNRERYRKNQKATPGRVGGTPAEDCGYDNDPVLQNFRQYGFRGALAKPFQLNLLKEILSGIKGEDKIRNQGRLG